MFWKEADISNLHFRSEIWKLDRFGACNWSKQVILRIHQRFWQIYVSQNKNKNKKYFCKSGLQCFSSKNILAKHKEVCLSINGAQYVRFEKRTIKFKKYFKQIPVPFKIFADFECNLKNVESYEGSYSKKYQDNIPCGFA